MSKKGLGKFALGTALGVGLGVLFAPESGEKTRKELMKKINELFDKLKEVDANEVKDEIERKLIELKEEITDLDKEKVLALAKEKAKVIGKKAEELVELAKEKGTPVLENAADSVRGEAIKVTKAVLDKLEKEEK